MQTRTQSPDPVQYGRRSPVRRFGVPFTVGALTVLLLFGALLVGLRVARAGALPGTVVAGTEVGGLERQELRDTVAGLAEERAGSRISVTRGDALVGATAGELGYALDVDATAEAVLARGRQSNPLTALTDHVRAFGDTVTVTPVERVDEAVVAAWAGGAATQLSADPVEGDVGFDGAAVTRTDPRPGFVVDAEPLRAMTLEAVSAGRPAELVADARTIGPATTQADVDAAFAVAQRAVSAPVRLVRGGQVLEFDPQEIGSVLSVRRDAAAEPVFRIEADVDAVAALVSAEERASFEVDPVDADITLAAGVVTIGQSSEGFRFDPQATMDQLLELATGDGPREAELAGEVVPPGRSTEDAQALGIVEQVSTFTTNHACCQSRVTNIHRIADIVRGVVVEPGETFSVNGFVGERTVENGFAAGGAIQNGEFVEEVGGGVSQFATTMFNAVFFGGYEFVEYKAHSQYISRYPEGREATLNFPTVDLKFRNNSPFGLLIDTSYTDTSITVSIWATKWVEVEAVAGGRTNFRGPETTVRTNPDLPAGSERVVQGGGGQGFDITVTRVLRFPDGREEREEFFTRYVAEPRIIERGS